MREIFDSTIERLFADLVTPDLVRESETGRWPTELWSALEDSGFALAAAPESLGGAGAGWGDLYGVVRAAGRFNLPSPLPEAMLANWLLGQAGIEALAGPLAFAAESTLKLEGGQVRGRLGDVPWGRHVEHVVAIAEGGTSSVVVLAVADASDKTLRLNTAGEPRDDLAFIDMRPVAFMPLPEGIPRDVLLLGGAMLRSAQTAGALQAALELTTTYAGERVQFGKAIGSFQAIQHQIAVLAEHSASAMIASEAAFAESAGELAELPVIAAKVCSAEAAGVGAGVVHAVHGAIGFTHEHPLHLTTRRLWSWRSEYGSLALWSQRLGRSLCANGAAQFWPTVTAGRLPALNGEEQ